MGKLSPPKTHEKYETGQFFLHRVFGYRGVILFPWRAKVYDRNSYVSPYTDPATDSSPLSELDRAAVTGTTTDGQAADATKGSTLKDTDTISARADGKKEITVNVQTYYQVLIDSRDCPHVVSDDLNTLFR